MITTSLSWSGEAWRLSVEPEDRLESLEANDHEGSTMHNIKQ